MQNLRPIPPPPFFQKKKPRKKEKHEARGKLILRIADSKCRDVYETHGTKENLLSPACAEDERCGIRPKPRDFLQAIACDLAQAEG